MPDFRKYVKKANQSVLAVQLDLETHGFEYQKWGATQRCVRGDWLVNNNGDTYTITATTFASTYTEVAPGRYIKTSPVFARVADRAGVVKTSEGSTEYQIGDYIVLNNENETDAYAVSKQEFESMYEAFESNAS